MAAPSLKHDGFLVPNAGGAGVLPRMAEVDQVDFNTLSQTHKWSVVEGCKVSVTVTTASVASGGIAIVNGKLVMVNSTSTADMGRGVEQDRFDLIAVGTDGNLRRIDGLPSFDPVFPDPGPEMTVLAAVFCPAGASSFSELVIDKRVMTPTALLTHIAPDLQLIRNVSVDAPTQSMTDLFTIRGDGYTVWNLDTRLERESSRTLKITDNLNLVGELQAGTDVSARNVTARNLVTSKNIFTGNSASVAGDEPKGAIRQDPNGRLYVNAATGWVEIATVTNTTPTGTIIQSVRTPGEMPPGWVQLGGGTINESNFPDLFTLAKLAPYISGTAPNRTMALPDLTDRSLLGTKTNLGETGSATLSLRTENLPVHKHNVKTQTGGATSVTGKIGPGGAHNHIQLADSGDHYHDVTDPGHAHEGMNLTDFQNPIPSAVIGLMWGGTNKIDAEFNDRNHTYSVEAFHWTVPAKTGIDVLPGRSAHKHILEGAPNHDHTLQLDGLLGHEHLITEEYVGSGVAFTNRPLAFFVFMYIKA